MAHSQHGQLGLITLETGGNGKPPSDKVILEQLAKELLQLLSNLTGEIRYVLVESDRIAHLNHRERRSGRAALNKHLKQGGSLYRLELVTATVQSTSKTSPNDIFGLMKNHGEPELQGTLPEREYGSFSIYQIKQATKQAH